MNRREFLLGTTAVLAVGVPTTPTEKTISYDFGHPVTVKEIFIDGTQSYTAAFRGAVGRYFRMHVMENEGVHWLTSDDEETWREVEVIS